MIIAYNPIQGCGPLRVMFGQSDLLSITAQESPEETGVYWIEKGKLLAIEFDNVKVKEDHIEMTIPETKDRFVLKMCNGNISLESTYFNSLAS